MMHKYLVLTAILFAGTSSFAATTTNGCTRETEVSARYLTAEVATRAGSCAPSSPGVFDHAQSQMVLICKAIGGVYKADSQIAECDLKVAEGSDAQENDVLVSGICTVEGLLSCKEKGKPTYWGVLHD